MTDEEEWRRQWTSRRQRRRNPRSKQRLPPLSPSSSSSCSSEWRLSDVTERSSDALPPTKTELQQVGHAEGGKRRREPPVCEASPVKRPRVQQSSPPSTAVIPRRKRSPRVAPSPPTPAFAYLFVLPADLSQWILTFLHPIDLIHLSSVSQACQQLTSKPSVWQPLVHQSWPITCHHRHDWRKVYVARIKRALGGASFFCTACDCVRAFPTAEKFQRHSTRCPYLRKAPAPTFQCPQPGCTSVFRYDSQLRTHVRSHSGQRKFPCTFTRVHEVVRHTLPPAPAQLSAHGGEAAPRL